MPLLVSFMRNLKGALRAGVNKLEYGVPRGKRVRRQLFYKITVKRDMGLAIIGDRKKVSEVKKTDT